MPEVQARPENPLSEDEPIKEFSVRIVSCMN